MKKAVAYTTYISITIGTTYLFYWLLWMFIAGVRFTAADIPPGDISVTGKIILSTGIPLFFVICVSIFYYMYRIIFEMFHIHLHKFVPINLNIVIGIGLIGYFNLFIFDKL
ncbi:MAG: hypothetical protein ABS944_01945 [Solibacillus sp.]|uniref:hypothetical protein n=1 Tax=unclassified Solibacillus TaxID=2637870 RepID=UPI0030F65892